jgi:S1-C subfamily serine protease
MKPASLAQVPWIGIKTFINQERVFIEQVAESSPAERGALKEGDEVVGVDDIALHGQNVWRIGSLLLEKKTGDRMSFAVRRDGKLFHREITLGMKPYRTWQ